MRPRALLVLACGCAALAAPAQAGVLEEDRADIMYHRYDGGGVEIDGPSVLVRKKFAEKYAVSANYYVDMVSSASIDVVTTASPYEEERTEYSLGGEYLRGKSKYSLGFTNSEENDYEANSASVSISQDMFGDLTTLQLSFARGWDKVSRRGDATFEDRVDRRVYGVDITQVATKSLILGFSWETITEEGFLNNPYRSVRYLDPESATGFSFQAEVYPRTRTGNALAVRGRHFLPWRAAAQAEYRWYSDSWGILGHTVELSYTHPWGPRWVFDARYRWYTQDAADFYADLFPRADFQNFLARDKELATMTSHTIGMGVSYELNLPGMDFLEKATVNFRFDHILFDYDDFRDLRVTGVPPGAEPLYDFSANVLQLFFSGWF
jgi:hypothetical protein